MWRWEFLSQDRDFPHFSNPEILLPFPQDIAPGSYSYSDKFGINIYIFFFHFTQNILLTQSARDSSAGLLKFEKWKGWKVPKSLHVVLILLFMTAHRTLMIVTTVRCWLAEIRRKILFPLNENYSRTTNRFITTVAQGGINLWVVW